MTVTSADTTVATRPSGIRDWRQIQRATPSAASAASRRVRRMRVILPLCAVFLVVILIGYALWDDVQDRIFIQFGGLAREGEELRMVSPSFSGVDSRGRPFVVTAETVAQGQGESSTYKLLSPEAKTAVGTPQEAHIISREGLYTEDGKTLDLMGDVIMRYGLGDNAYEFRTETASMNIDTNRVHGESFIEGESPIGTLQADGFEALERGEHVIFTGNVRARISEGGFERFSEDDSNPRGEDGS